MRRYFKFEAVDYDKVLALFEKHGFDVECIVTNDTIALTNDNEEDAALLLSALYEERIEFTVVK